MRPQERPPFVLQRPSIAPARHAERTATPGKCGASRSNRGDGSVRELAGDQFLAGPLKLVGGDLFFMDDNGDAGSPNTALRVLRGLAGSPVDLGSFQARAARFLYDESRGRFYWASGLHWAVGKVLTYEISGGAAPAVLFENQDVMGSSTSDAEYIYWLSNNAVTRLKKW